MISTYYPWEAVGEIQRALHQILLQAPSEFKAEELDTLDQIDQTLQSLLEEEV